MQWVIIPAWNVWIKPKISLKAGYYNLRSSERGNVEKKILLYCNVTRPKSICHSSTSNVICWLTF